MGHHERRYGIHGDVYPSHSFIVGTYLTVRDKRGPCGQLVGKALVVLAPAPFVCGPWTSNSFNIWVLGNFI